MNLKKQKEIQKHFEAMYQAGSKPWVDHGAESELDKFLELMRKRFMSAKILDIGCGDGWISLKFAKKGHKVWGIDSSKSAISQAIESAIMAQVARNTDFKVGDALKLPYSSGFFDAIVDRGLFHHMLPENRPIYLKNILRVLKTNSFFYLSVFSKRNVPGIGQLFTSRDIEKIFGTNFKIVFYSQDPLLSLKPAHLLHFILERSN